MHEHGAAAAGDARPRVVVELDDVVVEMIGAREPVAFAFLRDMDRLIIVPVVGVLAPAVAETDSPCRQKSARARPAVSAPPQTDKPENSTRAAAVALTFVDLDPRAADRHRNGQRAGQEPAARTHSRALTNSDEVKGGLAHG